MNVLKHKRYCMTNATNTKQIIKLIGSDKLELVKGHGYWYFIYDDLEAKNLYSTESVYTMYLNSCSVDYWVNVGKDFVSRMEKEIF